MPIINTKFDGIVFYNSIDPILYSKWPSHKYVWMDIDGNESILISEIISNSNFIIKYIKIEDKLFCDNVKYLKDHYDLQLFKVDTVDIFKKRKKIAFFVPSDTIVRLFLPVIYNIRNCADVIIFIPSITDENATTELKKNNIKYIRLTIKSLKIYHPDILVLGNDWDGEAKYVNCLCHLFNIKTICLQESVIDLKDKRINRLRWADFICVMGATTIRQIQRQKFFITGNPRYEKLTYVKNNDSVVLINCNFTYGIHEKYRKQWLDTIVNVLKQESIPYIISQHPRDNGNLDYYENVVRSNASIIHEQLEKCTLVVSRFSSIIHEAIFIGKPVIFFNPHKESIGYDFSFNNEFLFYCETSDCLRKYIHYVFNVKDIDSDKLDKYLLLNCNKKKNLPSELITQLLQKLNCLNGDGIKVNLFCGVYGYLKTKLGSMISPKIKYYYNKGSFK